MNLFETKLIEFTFYKFHFRVHDINVQFLEKKKKLPDSSNYKRYAKSL